ncbi:MAG: T9SS type A sorting domain-containing protein, partial [Bacteroidota bacterium]
SGGGGGGVGAIGANGSTTIRASVIVGNGVTDPAAAGGGLSIDWDLTLESTVIAGNSATRGSGEWDDISLGNNRTTSNGGNLVGINGFFDGEFPEGAPNANGDYVGVEAAPFEAMIEPLADNGGPTPTHLPMVDSPMLDAGVCPGGGADQRGSLREVDEPAIPNANGDACDMGSVEGRMFTVDAEPLAARTLRLGAPAPSPASGAVRLVYETDAPGDLTLTVVDLLGRTAATLARGPHAAGEHSATLDIAPLAPGVYVVRLTAPEAVAVQRVTVVR